METVEILAGAEFANAVHDLELASAERAYYHQPKPGSGREDYQVWLLSKEDFDSICAVDDEAWKENWGWWRYAKGSNMDSPLHEYIIHGAKIMAWDGYKRGYCVRTREYEDIISYFNNEIGASTEKNVCALAVHLARINEMTLSELFKKYLGGAV